VDFPTRFNNTSYSTIDNICTDNSRLILLKVFPIINGLSDHDAQYLTLNNLFLNKVYNLTSHKRLITKATISNFVTMLKDGEMSAPIMILTKAIIPFLNSFLLYFESCFPMHNTTQKLINNSWITPGIRISCKKIKSLHILSRKISCPLITKYYNSYCINSRKVIRNAKCNYCNSLLMTAENKSKTTWSIINNESGKDKNKNHTPLMFRLGKTFFSNRMCC